LAPRIAAPVLAVLTMSVFTPLARPELETFLAPYGLGRLIDFQGIAAGSENTNFFISLEQGEFVLTLVERGPVAEMPFFIELLDRSEEHTSELQSRLHLVCRLLLEKKNTYRHQHQHATDTHCCDDHIVRALTLDHDRPNTSNITYPHTTVHVV